MESEIKTLTSKPVERRPDPNIPVEDDHPLLEPDPEIRLPKTQSLVSDRRIEELEKKCAAFVRYDVYGALGRGELPWPEKILLAVGLLFLVPTRVAMGSSILVIYYVICRLCTAFCFPNREDGREDYAHMRGWQRVVIVRSGRFLARLSLFVFGFYFIREADLSKEVDGQLNDEPAFMDQTEELERPGAIVSNHVSYIDILYHMSSSFPSFVAKVRSLGCVCLCTSLAHSRLYIFLLIYLAIFLKRSVAELPLVGLISKCLGCVYVHRGLKSSDFKGVSGIVNERILEARQDKSAPRMMLFPEGTTTNGDYLLKFKTGAFLAKTPVLPVILRYPYQRFSAAWDSISGMRHLIFLLCQFVNYIQVTKLPVYHPSEQEKKDPKLYAENVRQLMALKGNLILSDVGLAEKRVYLTALDGLFYQQ
ncbi:lysophospholipid acyltransferase LPEAT1-like isoform X2 [Henckelia pumila]|uniref:lysophospholipid acyltransferase LPEAT1-like isoform X2 n=1 Tax=Henckelia pumila TaxID=405737 RepID=UPI003C6E0439